MASTSLLVPLGSSFAACLSTSQKTSRGKIRGMAAQCLSSLPRVKASMRTKSEAESISIRRRDVIHLVFGVSSLLIASSHAQAIGLLPEEKPKLCDDTCEKELENVPMVTTASGLQYKDIKSGAGPSPPVGFQVAANYVAMVPSGQIFDSSLEKGQIYIFRVGSGQELKGKKSAELLSDNPYQDGPFMASRLGGDAVLGSREVKFYPVIKGLDEGVLSMKVGGKRRIYVPGSLAFPKGLISAPGRPRVAPNSPVIFDVSLEYIPGLEFDEEEEE